MATENRTTGRSAGSSRGDLAPFAGRGRRDRHRGRPAHRAPALDAGRRPRSRPGAHDEPPSPADEAPFAAEPPVQMPAPARRLEPDLLSAVSQTDIPPIPSSHGQGPSRL